MPLKLNIPLPSKGLVVDRPAEYVDSRSASNIKNMEFNRNVIRKRLGTAAVGSSLGERIMRYFELQVGTTTRLFRAGLTLFQELNKTTSVWTDCGLSTNSFVVNTTNNKINFKIGAGELTATVASGTYTMAATQATAGSINKAIYDAIHAAEAAGTYTVTWSSSTGLLTIARSAGAFEIDWKTGTNGSDNTDTHIGTLIGFSDAADDTGGLTYAADSSVYYPRTGTAADIVNYTFPILSGAKIAVFTNGVDNVKKISITGNCADLGGSPPKARYCQAFGSYLVLAYIVDGGNTYYSRVQWCDTGDPETWSGGNANSVDLIEDPDDITGLGVFGNFLTVHKANSIYLGQLVTTSDVFRFDRKATGIGAIAGATISNIPSGEQIFLASDGLHLFNGITAPLIESPIQDELRESMNPAYMYKSQAIYVKELDEYWVCVPIGSDTEPQTVYKYNWRTQQVYKDNRTNLTALGECLNTSEKTWTDMTIAWSSASQRWDSVDFLSSNPIVVVGDSSGNSSKRISTTNDDIGVAVDARWETKDFTAEDFGIVDIDTMMRFKGLKVWAKGDNVTVYYSTDGGTSWTSAGTKELAADYPTDSAPVVVYFDTVSSKCRFRFTNSTLTESFTLKKYQPIATQREAVA